MSSPTVTPTQDREQDAGWRDLVALLGEQVGARLQAIAAVVRPLGWALLVLLAICGLIGSILGWDEFTLAAIILACLLTICAAFLIGRTEYSVTLDLARTRVVVGERAVGALTLSNPGRRAILPSRVVLPVGSGRGEFSIRRLASGQQAEELFTIPTQRRGVVAVGPVSIVRGDPLGIFERADRRDDPVDLYVHPQTIRFDGQSLGFVRDLEGLPAMDLSRDDVSFHALLEYQPGDDLRHVHWRSTARTGVMMVRQFEETRRSHFVVGLSRSRGDYRTDDDFELGISAAGSIGLRALSDSQHVDLRVQGDQFTARSGKQLLDSLAMIQPSAPRDGGIGELAGTISATAPQASMVVLVCGAAVSAEDLRASCARLPQATRTLVVIAASDHQQPSLRRIADADVVTLGALSQLPMALRRVLA
ncbi:MAG: DUF58 domain-containing protein [Propioniciclava sp.]